MGDLIRLWEPSVTVITESLAKWLPEHGSVSLPIDKLAVSVDEWRAAARKVGPIIGRPIRTRVGPYGNVEAWIADWPLDAREEDLEFEEQRRRAEAVTKLLFGDHSDQ